ncbi:Inorganic phosphate transporter 1-4 [Forsythia ovata]|uniref:Inorganic phosphate transporter 1-4 n=1 Tax=Forsythia ovata TaxID=205694 RepID=A0ABD1SPL8_9LAMI
MKKRSGKKSRTKSMKKKYSVLVLEQTKAASDMSKVLQVKIESEPEKVERLDHEKVNVFGLFSKEFHGLYLLGTAKKIDVGYPTGIGVRNSLIVLGCVIFLEFFFTFLVPESKGKSLACFCTSFWP